MARSESRSSRGSLRWFIPGGVQRARPKKIEALSREREREEKEEEGASEEETHTHTQEAERGGQRSFGGALPRGQEGRREGAGERRGLYLEEGAQGRKEDGERRRTIGKNEGAGRRGGREGRRMEQEINKKKKRRRKNGGVVGGEKPAWLERQVQRAKDATLRGRGYSRNCGWIHRLTPLRFRAASSPGGMDLSYPRERIFKLSIVNLSPSWFHSLAGSVAEPPCCAFEDRNRECRIE